MSRPARTIVWIVVALAALVAVWVAGGFLWPRPQFDRPGAPWARESIG